MTWPAISDYELPMAPDDDPLREAMEEQLREARASGAYQRPTCHVHAPAPWERRYNILHVGEQHTPKPTPKHALTRAIRRLLGR